MQAKTISCLVVSCSGIFAYHLIMVTDLSTVYMLKVTGNALYIVLVARLLF